MCVCVWGGGAEQVSPLSAPCPPSLAELKGPALRWGEGQQNQKKKHKTKAACSNRLLPKGCHGNRGVRGIHCPR